MPRAGLSPDVVVAEAAQLVDDEGPGALTLSALATRFHVAQPSLYKHVGGLEDLHGRLASLTARELASTLRRAVSGQSGAGATAAAATAYRRYAREHPGRYSYLLRPRPDDEEHTRASGEVLEVLYAVLSGYGVTDPDDLVDAARFLRSVLHGFASLETLGGFAMARSVDRSFESTVTAVDAALSAWGSARLAT